MFFQDPLFVVRGEVQKAVNTAPGCTGPWLYRPLLLQGRAVVGREESIGRTASERRNACKALGGTSGNLEEMVHMLGL
uniref:Uncharacterized protein n=1 Tax=Peromyscus maniculatus bairdii TaxID=230844 RepID=A0A8C8UH27_PERMB